MNVFNNILFGKSVLTTILVFILLSGFAVPLWAETRLELEEARITGARELPKVLYIVPWKNSLPGIKALPIRSYLEEGLEPLEIDVFRRKGRYYDLAHPREDAAR